jgi:hypothetical protein
VVAKVGERWAVSKQTAQNFEETRFCHRKLSDIKVRKHCQINISNRFAALDELNVREGINRAWENINENIKTSAKGSRSVRITAA